jgi:hypothetical protein
VSKTPRDPPDSKRRDQTTDERMAKLEKALADALSRSEAVEELLADQQQRLKALGTGREETMRALTEVRDELRRVSQERDQLRKQLTRVDAVQTATIALPEGDAIPPAEIAALPSLDELMAALGDIEMPRSGADGILHQKVEAEPEPAAHERDTDDSEEMISPALVFPEEYAATEQPEGAKDARVSRVLVLLDAERPIKYPLYKEVLTIGRAEIADIRINNGFLSRLHARVVSTPQGVYIEDVDSKNGIRVNTKLTPRQELKHGDVVDLGRLRFRFIDTVTGDDAD